MKIQGFVCVLHGALLLKGRRYEIWLVLHVAPLVQRGLCQVAGGCLAEDAGIRHAFGRFVSHR